MTHERDGNTDSAICGFSDRDVRLLGDEYGKIPTCLWCVVNAPNPSLGLRVPGLERALRRKHVGTAW